MEDDVVDVVIKTMSLRVVEMVTICEMEIFGAFSNVKDDIKVKVQLINLVNATVKVAC